MGLAEGSHFSIFLASCSVGLPKFFAAWGRSEAVAAAGEGARERFQIDAFPGGFCSKDHPCKGRRYNHHTVTTTIATTTTTTSIHSGDSWDTFAFSIDMHIRQRWILKLRKERLLHPFWSDLTHKSGLAWKPADSPDLQIWVAMACHTLALTSAWSRRSQTPWKVVLLAPRWRRAAVSGKWSKQRPGGMRISICQSCCAEAVAPGLAGEPMGAITCAIPSELLQWWLLADMLDASLCTWAYDILGYLHLLYIHL